ncbi:MAG: hypothetical protein J6L58_01130, partial [Clostridia bacterium]|nr:hypothetical protein [Clostridia bacterium]
MSNLKKSLSFILALALLVSSVFVGGITASAALDLYTTINTYDDESDITLESRVDETLQAPIISANDSWVYESFGSYGTSVAQDPLDSQANNVVSFGHIKSKTNSWPGAVRIYKQGTEETKTTFSLYTPKAETTYEYEFRYYVKAANVAFDMQIRDTYKRMHGAQDEYKYNPDRILTTAVSVEAGNTTDGWVTARGFFTTKSNPVGLGFFIASQTSGEDYNAEIYVDDIRISECVPMTVYNYDGENEETVYTSDYTTVSDLSIPERDGYILTGIYADAELNTKINGLENALDYADAGVYYGWAKLNRGEYYCGFENYTMGINNGSYNSATTSIVSGNTYAGAYNIRINAEAGSLNSFELRDKTAFETKAGTKYVISFQYRATADAKLYAGTAIASDVPGSATALQSGNLPAAADWTAASIEVTLKTGQMQGDVPVLMVQTTGAAVVELDHIYMTYPVEETQNLTNGFVTGTDWYPTLGESATDEDNTEEEENEASAVWNGNTEVPSDANGDGVYEIDTAEKLAYIIANSGTVTLADSTVIENGSFILTKDIYLNDITKYDWMSDTASYNLNAWYTSGDVANGFNGTIDGNFHTVYGLYSKYVHSCWTGNDGGRGLVPVVLTGQTATIKNLTVDYAHVDAETNAAAFVGNAQGGTVILDSCVAGKNIFVTAFHATALVSGIHDGIVTITNCASYAKTEIESLAAGETLDYACYGLVSGYFVKRATVHNSFNANGPIVAGYTGGVTAENCYETEAGTVAGVTLLTKEQMQGKSVLKIDGTMPALNVGGNYWTATKGYPVLTASTGAEVVEIDVWDGTRVQPTKTDTDGYILITNAEELAWVVYSGNMTGKNYRFTNNIFLNDVNLIDWETGKAAAGYVPKSWYTDIRTTATADDAATAAIESTVIDGNGYTVYGMYYEDNSTVDTKTGDLGTTRYHNIGLFSRIASNVNITVNKLGVDCTYINHYAAASPFFGNVGENGGKNYITIDQCYVGEDVKVHGGSSGAFIGYVCGGSCRLTVSNSYVLGTVINGSGDVAASKFTGNTWGVSFYTTVTNPETSAEETEVYGYFNNYTVGAVIGSGWNSGIRTHGSYANNYGAGYTGFESDGVTPYYWWHTNRTTDNMQGLDVFTNANKMPNLNTNSVFTATEGYPVLTAFVGKAYVKPVVEEEEEEDTETGEGGETEEEVTYEYWDGTSVAPTVGDGTEANPWKIYTGAELYYVIYNNGGAGVYYQLQNDIYLNDLSKINWQTGSIQYGYKVNMWRYGGSTAFQGNLDGNGYTVYGVYAHDGTIGPATAPTYSMGLISTIKGNTTVKNLGVD